MTHLTADHKERTVCAINGRNPLWGRANPLFLTAGRHVSSGYFCARNPGASSRLWREGGEYNTLRGNKPACLRTGLQPPATSAVVQSLIGGVVKRYPEGFDMTTQLIPHTIDNRTICQRKDDGYIHATAMCKAGGKRWDHYRANATTEDFLRALESDTGIPASQLVISKRGNSAAFKQGTWVHPKVALHLAQWISPAFAVQVVNWVYDWMNDRTGNNPVQVRPKRLPRWTPTRADMRMINSHASQILQTRFSAVRDALLAQIRQDRAAGHTRPLCDYSVAPTALLPANDAGWPPIPQLEDGQAVFMIDGQPVRIDFTTPTAHPDDDVIAIAVSDGTGPERFTIKGDVPAASWFDRCHLAKPRNSRDLIRPVVVVIGTIIKDGGNEKTHSTDHGGGDPRGIDHDGV